MTSSSSCKSTTSPYVDLRSIYCRCYLITRHGYFTPPVRVCLLSLIPLCGAHRAVLDCLRTRKNDLISGPRRDNDSREIDSKHLQVSPRGHHRSFFFLARFCVRKMSNNNYFSCALFYCPRLVQLNTNESSCHTSSMGQFVASSSL